MKNIFLIKVFILFFLSHVIGQDDRCHADIDWERSATIQKILKQNQQYNAKNYNGETPMIRLVLHNIHEDNGSGGYDWADKIFDETLAVSPNPFDNTHNATNKDLEVLKAQMTAIQAALEKSK